MSLMHYAGLMTPSVFHCVVNLRAKHM